MWKCACYVISHLCIFYAYLTENSKQLVFEKWGSIYLGHKNAIEISTLLDEFREPNVGIFVLWVFSRFLLSSDGNWAFSESFYVYNSLHTVVLFLMPCILYLATYEWPLHDGKTFILPFKIRARWDKDFLMVQCYLFSPFCAVLSYHDVTKIRVFLTTKVRCSLFSDCGWSSQHFDRCVGQGREMLF